MTRRGAKGTVDMAMAGLCKQVRAQAPEPANDVNATPWHQEGKQGGGYRHAPVLLEFVHEPTERHLRLV